MPLFYFRNDARSLYLVTDLISYLKSLSDAKFLNMGEVYDRFYPAPGEGFRDE